MAATTFDEIDASIAILPHEVAGRCMWAALRSFAQDATGSTTVVFLAVYGQTIVGRGDAVVTIDQLVDQTGLPERTVEIVLRALERSGLVLAKHLDDRTRRVTMPCLIAHDRQKKPPAIARDIVRVLH